MTILKVLDRKKHELPTKHRVRTGIFVTLVASCLASSSFAEEGPAPEYDPELESLLPGEPAAQQEMQQLLMGAIDKSYASRSKEREGIVGHDNQMLRDAHPKAIGCVSAKIKFLDQASIRNAVLPRLPERRVPDEFFSGGLLAAYAGVERDAVIRFSSAAGEIKPDYEPDARGMAMKILGIEGEKWAIPPPPNSGSTTPNQFTTDAYQGTQDFVMIDNAAFPFKDSIGFKDIVAFNTGVEGALQRFLLPSPDPRSWRFQQILLAGKFNGKKPEHLLGVRFHSVTPYAWFGFPTKFSAIPSLKPVKVNDGEKNPNILRAMMQETLKQQAVQFDFSIQIRPKNEPGVDIRSIIEDATAVWNESASSYPFVKIATITIPQQTVDNQAKLKDCDSLSFNLWNSLKVYRPVGSMNRARRAIYKAISDHRHQFNKAAAGH